MKFFKPYILLGTYNGSKYLAEQISSIQRQEVKDWKLLIRDDGSTDDTIKIITDFANVDDRIETVNTTGTNLGVVRNYGKLMEIALRQGAEIILLADQDDVWLPRKMKIQISRMKKMEYKFGKNTPILIHTNLTVVDKTLRTICQSFMTYQGIENETKHSLGILLVQNFVTGCSIMINRSLLKAVLPIPKNVLMHDWWIALCASVFGKIDYIDIPTVLYRQHDTNKIGAKSYWNLLNPLRINRADRWKIGMRELIKTIEQAKQLSEKIGKTSSVTQKNGAELIRTYASCLSLTRKKD